MAMIVALWERAPRGRGARLPDPEVPPQRGARSPRCPPDLHPRLAECPSQAAGSTQLFAHQAEAFEAARPRRARHRLDRHRQREDARLQPPGAGRPRGRPEAARALPLPDEGARPGPGAGARRASGSRACGRRSTTATREHERRWQIRKWANVILTNPDMLHVGRPAPPRPLGRRPPEPALRRRRRGPRLPRRLRLPRRERPPAPAPGRRPSTAPSRSSSSPRRRSRTRASWRARSSGSTRPSSTPTRHRRPSGRSPSGTRRSSTPSSAQRASALGDGVTAPRRARLARPADDLLHEEPESGRAGPPLRVRARAASSPSASRPTGPGTRPPSGGRSSAGSSRASCSA